MPGLVALSLQKTIKTYPAIGWVRADQVANVEILSEVNDLRKQNQELETLLSENLPMRKILNSGDDIDSNFVREERTALFINLAGVHAQQALSVVDEGIASIKLSKILANVLIDWHWLSFKYPKKFYFYGSGELHWAPVRDGAAALVVPGIEYAGIKLHQGFFANLIDLFNESFEYRKYGFRGVTGEKQLLFPPLSL